MEQTKELISAGLFIAKAMAAKVSEDADITDPQLAEVIFKEEFQKAFATAKTDSKKIKAEVSAASFQDGVDFGAYMAQQGNEILQLIKGGVTEEPDPDPEPETVTIKPKIVFETAVSFAEELSEEETPSYPDINLPSAALKAKVAEVDSAQGEGKTYEANINYLMGKGHLKKADDTTYYIDVVADEIDSVIEGLPLSETVEVTKRRRRRR